MKQLSKVFTATMIIVLIIMPSCSKNKNRYHDKEKKFSIVIPKEWEKKTGFMGTDLAVYPPYSKAVSSFSPNFNVSVLDYKDPQQLGPYTDGTLENLQKLNGFILLKREKVKLGDEEAARLVYSYKIKPLDIMILQYIVVKDTRGAAVTFSAMKEDYADLVPETEKTIKTFRLE